VNEMINIKSKLHQLLKDFSLSAKAFFFQPIFHTSCKHKTATLIKAKIIAEIDRRLYIDQYECDQCHRDFLIRRNPRLKAAKHIRLWHNKDKMTWFPMDKKKNSLNL